MSLLEQWREFVLDPSRAGRYLSSIGASVEAGQAPAIDSNVVQHFLEALAAASTDVWFLGSIVDLLSAGYGSFCSQSLPALLDSLSNEHVGENAVVGPALRGNVRWDLTAVARHSGRISPVQFLTRLPARSFALPENQLVRWLVDSLERSLREVEERIGSKALPPQLRMIRDGCREANRHPWFKDVPSPKALEVNMITSAQRQRLPAYRLAATLSQRRRQMVDRNRASRWLSVRELLSVNWLSPLDEDDLFELYGLTLVLDVLEHEAAFGPPHQYGLAISGRAHVARFVKGASTVTVYFDQSPVTFLGCHSAQLAIQEAHLGVRSSPRRPDIVIVHQKGEERHIVLVEAKNSWRGSYLSDGIYKALAYIADFKDVWRSDLSNPKVVLLVPEDISLRSGVALNSMSVVLVSSFDRAAFAAGIKTALSLNDGVSDHH
ncbi:hypothetical protein GA0061099_1003665 [Bradyrhizobium yuanmingense]|uniref:DUF2357 domain-containing protein n=1 Tax=Bradyrhizobium yuanmingense TaxID=108015 RepID=A0A1C3VDS6_9BRAD|nr:hypothetical protein IQ15_03422 [Bradyrhizobium yuanmingense]SCB25916.1 hypothetical protein GA0061099_1003665 [Bradyrhizobium yuanmingense]